MGMNKTPIHIVLSAEDTTELERRSRSQTLPHREVVRARLILLLAAGMTVSAVAREVNLRRRIINKWAQRFLRQRMLGLEDTSRSGRPARFSPRSGAPAGEAGLRAA